MRDAKNRSNEPGNSVSRELFVSADASDNASEEMMHMDNEEAEENPGLEEEEER